MRCHYIFMLIRFYTEVWFKTEFKTWFKRKDKVTQCTRLDSEILTFLDHNVDCRDVKRVIF